jgi:hypothetical protein
MNNRENILAEFIAEQADILAKLAQIEGLETLAVILHMAKAEAHLTQKKLHEEQGNEHTHPN